MIYPFGTPFKSSKVDTSSWPSNLFAFIVRSSRRHQIGIGFVSLSIAALSVAPIELQRQIVNRAIEGKDFDLLMFLAGLFLVAILALQAGKFLLGTYQNWIAQSVILKTRRVLFREYRGTKDCEDEDNAGKAVTVIGNEIEQVGVFVGAGISDLIADAFKLIFAIGYMLYVEPMVTLVALIFFAPQIVLVPYLQQWLNTYIRERTDLLRSVSDQVSDLDKHEDEAEGFDEKTGEVFTNRAKSTSVKFIIKTMVNTLNSLAPLSVLVFGGYMYINGDTTLGTIVAFTSGFDRMAGPLRALVNYYRIASLRQEQYEKIVTWSNRER